MTALLAAKADHPAEKGKAPALLVPFTRAAREHVEQFVDASQIITSTSTQLGPYDVPAYGFMRGIFLQVDATGGAGTSTVTALEDAPWSAIQEVSVLDVNGAPIVGPLSGFDLYLIHKYGGYSYSSDPRQSPQYSAVATGASASGNFAFMLRIPIEVNGRDALGSLANQNASSTYKLRITLAPSSSIYGTAPNTTLPTVRIRASLDAWSQPTTVDLRGNSQATLPPAHGTTSYWSKTTMNLGSGNNTVRLPRVGNYLRNLIFVFRATSDGTRATADTQFPDPAALYWDTRLLQQKSQKLWQHQMQTRYDLTGSAEGARGRDKAVYVEGYTHDFDGQAGFELRDLWLPTVQSTRLELQGSFGVAGTLTVITNDVSPAGEVFV